MRKITLYISGVFKCNPEVGNYQKTLNYIENDISFKSIKKILLNLVAHIFILYKNFPCFNVIVLSHFSWIYFFDPIIHCDVIESLEISQPCSSSNSKLVTIQHNPVSCKPKMVIIIKSNFEL